MAFAGASPQGLGGLVAYGLVRTVGARQAPPRRGGRCGVDAWSGPCNAHVASFFPVHSSQPLAFLRPVAVGLAAGPVVSRGLAGRSSRTAGLWRTQPGGQGPCPVGTYGAAVVLLDRF